MTHEPTPRDPFDAVGICPRCGDVMPTYRTGLSRWDNRTDICGTCSTAEALCQFKAQQRGESLELIRMSVHPQFGTILWERPELIAVCSQFDDSGTGQCARCLHNEADHRPG